MPETVLFETEASYTREQIADYLEAVAANLRSGEAIQLRAGEESIELDPPSQPTFEVKAEREGPPEGQGELSIEFEIEWDEGSNGADLEIA